MLFRAFHLSAYSSNTSSSSLFPRWPCEAQTLALDLPVEHTQCCLRQHLADQINNGLIIQANGFYTNLVNDVQQPTVNVKSWTYIFTNAFVARLKKPTKHLSPVLFCLHVAMIWGDIDYLTVINGKCETSGRRRKHLFFGRTFTFTHIQRNNVGLKYNVPKLLHLRLSLLCDNSGRYVRSA